MKETRISSPETISAEAPDFLSPQKKYALLEEKYFLLEKENEQLKIKYAQLEFQLQKLQRLIFASKSERFIPSQNPMQLSLLEIPASEEVEVQKKEIAAHTRTSITEPTPPSRQLLPAHLLREITVIEPAEKQDDWKEIGREISEQLEYKAAQLFVKQTIRPRYAKPGQAGIVVAELPGAAIEKCIAGPSLLAQVVIEKYVDHLPIYRQVERYKRLGYQMSDSTLGGWIRQTTELISPLHDVLKKKVLQSNYLQADETPHPVLDREKKGATHRGYFWVYHAVNEKLILYDYRKTRSREGPAELLQDFHGHLQTDGYAVYDHFGEKENITLVGCMAHARRYFEEALQSDRIRAEFVLQKIQELYQVEKLLREEEKTAEEILHTRQEKSLPILHQLEVWMKENILKSTPKSPIGQAIAYALSRWKKLECYTTDARLRIDNNLVENHIRPSVVGRKNYLFAGSHEGAARSAMLYSFMLTCKVHNINPHHWLSDVLQKINDTKYSKLETLLPDKWKQT